MISFNLNSRPSAGMNVGSTLDVFCKVGKDRDCSVSSELAYDRLSSSNIWRVFDNILTTQPNMGAPVFGKRSGF